MGLFKKVPEPMFGNQKAETSEGYFIVVNKDGDIKVYDGRNKFGYVTEGDALRDMADKMKDFAIVVTAKNKNDARKKGEHRFFISPLEGKW